MDTPALAVQQNLTCIHSVQTLNDLPGVMDDTDKWQERFREICAVSMT